MATCTVKRTAVVTVIMSENEASIVKTLLGRVSSDPRSEVKSLYGMFIAQNIPDHPDKKYLTGEIHWPDMAPF